MVPNNDNVLGTRVHGRLNCIGTHEHNNWPAPLQPTVVPERAPRAFTGNFSRDPRARTRCNGAVEWTGFLSHNPSPAFAVAITDDVFIFKRCECSREYKEINENAKTDMQRRRKYVRFVHCDFADILNLKGIDKKNLRDTLAGAVSPRRLVLLVYV